MPENQPSPDQKLKDIVYRLHTSTYLIGNYFGLQQAAREELLPEKLIDPQILVIQTTDLGLQANSAMLDALEQLNELMQEVDITWTKPPG